MLQPAKAASAADDQYRLAASRPLVTGELQEVPRVAIPVTRQPEFDTGALQEVHKVDVHPTGSRG